MTDDEVEILIKCRGSLLTLAVIEFYLEWLEALDCGEDCDIFAAVAAGFAKACQRWLSLMVPASGNTP